MTIRLEIHKPHSMAAIYNGDQCVFMGNFWDFHKYCYGTRLRVTKDTVIDFADVWDESISSPQAVAAMVARHLYTEVEVVNRKEEFNC